MDLTALGARTYPAAGAGEAVLVLAHGAGAGQGHPFMTAMASGLAARGIDVATFDFPYMRAGRRVPDRAPVLEQAFREVADAARAWSGAPRLFLGGKSMGGRMATHLAAAGVEGLAGVVVFGYPLHPPGKPEQVRVQHLPSITVPLLVIQGERDAFGGAVEVRSAMTVVAAPVTVHAIAGGDHSLAVRGRSREDVLGEAVDLAAAWMRAPSA